MRISDWSSDVCSSDLAAEEDHIVRMGLLASGAAHELGTPLSTLSVILGDWHHEPAFQSNPQLLEEIEDMQAEVKRSEERRVGTECVRTCRSRWSQAH